MDKNKKLTYLADELLRKKEHADALRDLGERNPEQASAIENILAAFSPIEDVVTLRNNITKFESVISLIKSNIKLSKGYDNFPESEYIEDKNRVFNIKHKVIATNSTSNNVVDKSVMVEVNNIYKKHLNIQTILIGS